MLGGTYAVIDTSLVTGRDINRPCKTGEADSDLQQFSEKTDEEGEQSAFIGGMATT